RSSRGPRPEPGRMTMDPRAQGTHRAPHAGNGAASSQAWDGSPPGHTGSGAVPVVVVRGRAELGELVRSVAGDGARVGMHRWAEGEAPVEPERIAAELAAADAGVVCL